jgi:hypothetical protein
MLLERRRIADALIEPWLAIISTLFTTEIIRPRSVVRPLYDLAALPPKREKSPQEIPKE